MPEVDRTVERLRAAGAAGARIMVGGGFGGAILGLFPPGATRRPTRRGRARPGRPPARPMTAAGLRAATEKMRADGQPPEAVRTFARAYKALRDGASGTLADRDLEPVADVPRAAAVTPVEDAAAALDRVAVIKLNGGLGTSMGMTRAKSLIEARDGLSFLDVIARQTLALRARHGVRLPLVLMDSYRTRDDRSPPSPGIRGSRPTSPRTSCSTGSRSIRADDLRPVEWPGDPELEWCPPGHGDLYPALAARACSPRCSSAATTTRSSRTPTTSERSPTRTSRPGAPPRACRSRWRSSRGPRPTARAATSRGARGRAARAP